MGSRFASSTRRPLTALAQVVWLLLVPGCTVRAATEDASVAVDAPLPDAPPDAPAPDAGRAPAIFIQPGARADAPDRFAPRTEGAIELTIAYPFDGVLLPPNLDGLEVQFGPRAWDLYEIRFEQAGEPRMLVYDDCEERGDGCAVSLSDEMWAVLETERAAGPFRVVVRAIQLSGGPIARSTPITVELTSEPVTGGLYFWSTDPAAIHRYDFDRASRESEIFYDTSDSGGRCVGCHALSRDGRSIAIGTATEGPIVVVDVASRVSGAMIAGEMSAFSPDALELVVGGIPDPVRTTPVSIVRVDGSGSPIVLGEGAAPDWSPDGDTIVATTPSGALQLWDRGASWVARSPTFTPGGTAGFDEFGAFGPDSEWIAFSRVAPGDTGSHVWAARRDGGSPRLLANASRGEVDSMPRWNPSTFLHRGRRLFWLTLTSDVAYGLEPRDPRRRQIWMAAFDPTVTDGDPSRAPFRLPSQPSTGSSFIPQWTSTVFRQPCDESGDCRTGEMCEDGICVPEII